MAQIVIFNNKGGVAHEKLHIIQQPINEITDALNQAGISNYYKGCDYFIALLSPDSFIIYGSRLRTQGISYIANAIKEYLEVRGMTI